MVKYDDAVLDRVFGALADPTRRGVLEALGQGGEGRTISELAAPYGMSLPGFMKHLAVLETAGLIARSKEGRVVRCELDAAPMQEAAMWMARYQRFWSERLDALGRYLYHQEEVEAWKEPEPNKTPPASTSSAAIPSRPKRSGARGPTRKR